VAHSGHARIKEMSRQIKKDRAYLQKTASNNKNPRQIKKDHAYLKGPRQIKKLCSKLPQNNIKKKKVKNIL